MGLPAPPPWRPHYLNDTQPLLSWQQRDPGDWFAAFPPPFKGEQGSAPQTSGSPPTILRSTDLDCCISMGEPPPQISPTPQEYGHFTVLFFGVCV